MLTHLSIRNIVLIDQCDLALGKGLCVLSGETGAGKSILLDSLGLALGERAEVRLIRQSQDQGAVVAEFNIGDNEAAQAILQELELAQSDSVLIRRTLSADGKSRCFINDEPVSQAALKKLGQTLVEIHGQHDQRGLLEPATHRQALDEFGGLGKERVAVAEAYAVLASVLREIAILDEAIASARREQDYLRHMRSELAQLAPKAGEEDELSTRRTQMMQSEKLFELLNEVLAMLGEGKSVSGSIRSAQRLLARSSLAQGARMSMIVEQLDRAAEVADEAVEALETLGREATYDPQKLERIEERLFALKAAGRKYNLPVDELAALHQQVEEKLGVLDGNDARRKLLEAQLQQARPAFVECAEKLSRQRRKAAAAIEKAVMAELVPLKMETTRFRVGITPLPEAQWGEHGADSVAFEVATNVPKGGEVPYAPIGKIASGGELSRFMLAMKVALSHVRMTPTLIFDEIDTGTGGAVADAIGRRLMALGEKAQVLVVTHLPQVAARGASHWLVSKEVKGKQVITSVTVLDATARKEEIARMLAGATITPEARKAAQKLLEDAA